MLDNQNGGTVLNSRHNLKGMTLVEIMVALAVVIILFAAAAPNFSTWIQNTRIRTAADAIQNGLSLARSEAVHRNTIAQFVSCGGGAWDVVVVSAVANTNVCNAALATAGWARIQASPTKSGSDNSLITTAQATIGFNGLGRQVSTTDLASGTATPNPPVAVDINVSATLAGASCAPGGQLRCLRISISPGGQVRMCDPALAVGTPQGC